MRLISTLASSFLFVPIVLADYHSEKYQPRSLNSIKKNINDASVDQTPWAGASLHHGNEGGYTYITGAFNAPLIWDANDTGISVIVGIGGVGGVCNDSNIGFAVGVDVWLTGNGVSYDAWTYWGDKAEWAPNDVNITTGDFMRATVAILSATTGSALLENLSTGKRWGQNFTVDGHPVCQKNAQWIVSGWPGSLTKVPKFSSVSVLNARANTADGATVIAGEAIINNMTYNNMPLTTAMADEDVVVVAREL